MVSEGAAVDAPKALAQASQQGAQTHDELAKHLKDQGYFVAGHSIGKARHTIYLPSPNSTGEFQRVTRLARQKRELANNVRKIPSKSNASKSNNQPSKAKGSKKSTKVVSAPSAKFVKNISLGPVIGAANMAKSAWDMAESFVVSNKELIAAVGGNGAADFLERILVNPGDTIFELLAQEAAGFTQYVVEKMDFEYHPQVPTDTSGSVLLAIDYDVNDDPDYQFMTSDEIEKHISTNKGAVTTPVWDTVKAKGDTKAIMSSGERKLVLADPLPITDLETYDACQLLIKGNGLPTGAPAGKVWCDYRIRFFEPKLNLPKQFGITDFVVSPDFVHAHNGSAVNLMFKSGDSIMVNPHRLVIDDIGAVYGIRLPAGLWRISLSLELDTVLSGATDDICTYTVNLVTRSYTAKTGATSVVTVNTKLYKNVTIRDATAPNISIPFFFDFYINVDTADITEGNDQIWRFFSSLSWGANTGVNTIKNAYCLLQPI